MNIELYEYMMQARQWLADHPAEYLACVIGVVLGICLLLFVRNHRKNVRNWLDTFVPTKKGMFLKREREKFVDALLADDLVSLWEDRVYRGEITRQEANKRYRKLGDLLKNKNLIPSPHLLKDLITKRMAAKIHDPVALPDAGNTVKPAPPVITNVVDARKKFGARALDMRKTA